MTLKNNNFMTRLNSNNGYETKSDIFQWDIFKSDITYFFVKKYSIISLTFKIKVSSFYN